MYHHDIRLHDLCVCILSKDPFEGKSTMSQVFFETLFLPGLCMRIIFIHMND